MVAETYLRSTEARHGRMTYFASDTGAVSRSLELYGEWAEREINFAQHFLRAGATVLDIGAYVGTHTLAFSRFVGKTGKVLSFEPQPESYGVLDRNVAANNLRQVTLHHAAVSSAPGEIDIAVIDFARSDSFGSLSLSDAFAADAAVAGEHVAVPVTTVDQLALEACDFIKIDVEGLEDQVLKGSEQTLRRCKPAIYAECNSVDAGVRVLAELRRCGYAARLHLARAFNPDNFNAVGENIFAEAMEAAIVGVPKEKIELLERIALPAGDMLIEIETADRLVLGMLNKPQYVGEILEAETGAEAPERAWIDSYHGQRLKQDELLQQRQVLLTQVEQLNAVLDQTRAEQAQLADTLASSREIAAARAAEVEKLRAQGARDNAEIRRLIDEVTSLAKGAEAARAMADQAVHQISRAQAVAKRAAFAGEEARRAAEAAGQARVDAIGAQLDALHARLLSVYASTSWRITKPLRGLGRLLKG